MSARQRAIFVRAPLLKKTRPEFGPGNIGGSFDCQHEAQVCDRHLIIAAAAIASGCARSAPDVLVALFQRRGQYRVVVIDAIGYGPEQRPDAVLIFGTMVQKILYFPYASGHNEATPLFVHPPSVTPVAHGRLWISMCITF